MPTNGSWSTDYAGQSINGCTSLTEYESTPAAKGFVADPNEASYHHHFLGGPGTLSPLGYDASFAGQLVLTNDNSVDLLGNNPHRIFVETSLAVGENACDWILTAEVSFWHYWLSRHEPDSGTTGTYVFSTTPEGYPLSSSTWRAVPRPNAPNLPAVQLWWNYTARRVVFQKSIDHFTGAPPTVSFSPSDRIELHAERNAAGVTETGGLTTFSFVTGLSGAQSSAGSSSVDITTSFQATDFANVALTLKPMASDTKIKTPQ